MTEKKAKNAYPTKVSTPVPKFKVASHILRENSYLPPKNYRKIFVSLGTAGKIIKSDLKLVKTKKHDVYCLTAEKHSFQQKTMCRF